MSIVSDFKGKDCGFMLRRCAKDTIYIKSLNNLGLCLQCLTCCVCMFTVFSQFLLHWMQIICR